MFILLFQTNHPLHSQTPATTQTSYIAYFSTQGAAKPGLLGDLILFDPSTMQVVDTVSIDAEPSSLAWSPDGNHLAMTTLHEDAGRLAVLDRETLTVQDINTQYRADANASTPTTADSQFVWFQNNQSIMFSQIGFDGDTLTSTIMWNDTNGETLHLATPDTLAAFSLSLSPANDRLVFVGYPTRMSSKERDVPSSDLYMASLNTGEIERLTDTSASEGMPDWSSNGTQVVYTVHSQLTILDIVDRDTTELAITNAAQPQWTQGDTHIIYSAIEDDQGYLRIVELATNDVETIATNDFIGPYTLSPDRIQVAYLTRQGDAPWQLCGYDLQSNQPWCATEIPEPHSATRLAWG